MFYSTLFIICKIIIIYIIHLKKPRFREVQQPIQSTQLINSIFWAELRYLNLSPDYYRKIKVHFKSTLEWEYWSPAKEFILSICFVSERKLFKIMRKEMYEFSGLFQPKSECLSFYCIIFILFMENLSFQSSILFYLMRKLLLLTLLNKSRKGSTKK